MHGRVPVEVGFRLHGIAVLALHFPQADFFQNAEFFPYCYAYDSSASAQTIAYTPTYVVKIT